MVSVADREVEETIRRELARAFPGEAVLGEEGGGEEADRVWVVDPIDGTSNFLRGLPWWGVAIAYVVDGVVEIGVTAQPVTGTLWWARRGHGAFRDGEPIEVSARTRAEESCAALSFTFKQDGADLARLVERLHRHGMEQRRLGSTAINLCYVADGRLDAAICPYVHSWDCLAGLVLVEEAGGVVTRDWRDGGLSRPRAVAACTPALADTVREISGIGGELP